MKEIWKDIEGYEGLYQVSNLGRVRSLDRTIVQKNGSKRSFKGQIITQHQAGKGYGAGNGYLHVTFKNKNFSVHRLVAKAFIPNPENKPEVDHIDGDKRNNIVFNLRWATKSENMKNPNTIGGTIKPLLDYTEKSKRPVFRMHNGAVGKRFDSIREAAVSSLKEGSAVCSPKAVHSAEESIRQVIVGRAKSAYGYQWKYA